MRVDLLKLIQDFLFSFIREPKVIEFIRSLLSETQKAHNDFELFGYDAKYRANANASVISLEHHINREFDVKAQISELDGKPIDFLVTIAGSVDEVRLRALIDRYKLSGKSYAFKLEYTFEVEFMNYQCESLESTCTAEFLNFVCEQKDVVTISVSVEVNSGNLNWLMKITSSQPVYSDLQVTADVYFGVQGEMFMRNQDMVGILRAGTSSNHIAIENTTGADLSKVDSFAVFYVSINPEGDDLYMYKSNN